MKPDILTRLTQWRTTGPGVILAALVLAVAVTITHMRQTPNASAEEIGAYAVSALVAIVGLLSYSGGGGPGGAGGTGSGDGKDQPNPPAASPTAPARFVQLVWGALLAIGLAVGLPGCSWFAAALPYVVAIAPVVQEAAQILAWLESRWTEAKSLSPGLTKHDADVARAFADAHLSLDALLRVSNGARDAQDGHYKAALDDFRVAWQKLAAVLRDVGVAVPKGLTAAPGSGRFAIPEPMILKEGK